MAKHTFCNVARETDEHETSKNIPVNREASLCLD